MKSTRKPHNDTAGYVCELKSKHPKLSGHIMIIDRTKGGNWIDADYRWVVVHMDGDQVGCNVAFPSLDHARDCMKSVASGDNFYDLGQHE